MLKKTFAALAVAGLLVLGAGSAASAATYPVDNGTGAGTAVIAPGASTPITISGLGDIPTVTFRVTSGPSGATLASVVVAAAGPAVTKPVVNGSATANFSSTTAGDFTITITDPSGNVVGTTAVTVAVPGSAAPGAGLPATGGSVPAAALWIGVGAIGIGGIAVAAAVARRRAAGNR